MSVPKVSSCGPGQRCGMSRFAYPFFGEAKVLNATRAARFTLVQVERRHSAAGLIVRDLVRDEVRWLVDEGLAGASG